MQDICVKGYQILVQQRLKSLEYDLEDLHAEIFRPEWVADDGAV